MNPLEPLARTALMGTNRQPLPPPTVDGEPGLLLAAIATQQTATNPELALALLQSAGVIALCGQAGVRPLQPVLTPFPRSATEPGSLIAHEGFNGLLANLLEHPKPRLLIEALRELAARHLIAPFSLLPALLELGRNRPELRPFLRPVLGERGAWLARLNPLFNWAGGTETEAAFDWETAAHAGRRAHLAGLRRTAPEQAMALLATDFAKIAAKERAELLAEWREGLSMADEPFLENCLGDRSREVRAQAARLLSLLPESRLVARMGERLSTCLSRNQRGTWVIVPPPAFDPLWARDGILEQFDSGQGPRAGWLQQISAALPLGWWERHLAMTPAEICHWVVKGDWGKALGRAIGERLSQEPAPAWVKALLDQPKATFGLEPSQLVPRLPEDEQEGYWLALLNNPPGDGRASLAELVQWANQSGRGLWAGVSQAAIALAARLAASHPQRFRWLFEDVLLVIHPSLIAGLLDDLQGEASASAAADAVAPLMALLSQRQRLHHLLNQLGPGN